MQAYYDLRLGNCLEVLKKIPSKSIDMIFADPPYNLSNGGFTCEAGKMVSVNKGKWDETKGLQKDFELHYSWLEACKRVLKDNGTLWVSGTYHSIYACGYALQQLEYRLSQRLPKQKRHLESTQRKNLWLLWRE